MRDNDSVFTKGRKYEEQHGMLLKALPAKRPMLQPLDYFYHPDIVMNKVVKPEREGTVKKETYSEHMERVKEAYKYPKKTIDKVSPDSTDAIQSGDG